MKLVHKDLVKAGFTPNPLPRGVVLEQSDAEKLQVAVKEFLDGNENKPVEAKSGTYCDCTNYRS